MSETPAHDVTGLLVRWRAGERPASTRPKGFEATVSQSLFRQASRTRTRATARGHQGWTAVRDSITSRGAGRYANYGGSPLASDYA